MSSTCRPGTVAERRAQRIHQQQHEAKSWGEAIQRYHVSRNAPAPALSAARTQSAAPSTTTALHPILQKYNNDSVEKTMVVKEQEMKEQQRKNAVAKRDALPSTVPYNIINNELSSTSKRVGSLLHKEKSKTVTLLPDAEQGYIYSPPPSHPPLRDHDILTNLPKFKDSEQRMKMEEERNRKYSLRAYKEQRDYNIINTRYQFEEHDVREAREAEQARQQALQRYWATSHYNPIINRFVHPEEEARYQTEKHACEKSHGLAQYMNYPNCIKQSEGMTYNIVVPTLIKNQQQLEMKEAGEAQKLVIKQHSKTHFELTKQQQDIELDNTASLRSFNRVSAHRYNSDVTRGYDPITNEPYEGRGAKQLHLPMSLKQLPLDNSNTAHQTGIFRAQSETQKKFVPTPSPATTTSSDSTSQS